MWNEAFALGGPACTMQQFEQLTGVRLDHFVVVDFEGFRGMVDAIGGVEMCIPEDDRRPGPRHPHRGRHPQAEGQRGAQLRPGAVRRRQRLRRRPDEAAAGVHRVDGPPGRHRRHPGPPGPADPVPRRGDQVADRRPGPEEHRQDRRPRASSSRTSAWTTSSSSPSRSSPTPSDPNRLACGAAAGRPRSGTRSRNDEPLTKRLSQDVISAGNLPGKSGVRARREPVRQPIEQPDARAPLDGRGQPQALPR